MNKEKIAVNVQNIFLNKIRIDRDSVNIFLSSGVRLYGTVKGFDEYTVVLENQGNQTLIYKNNIVSITPHKPIKPIKESSAS